MEYDSLEWHLRQAERHRGDHSSILSAHRHAARIALREGGESMEKVVRVLFRRIADFRTLRCAMEHLERYGGHAPGVDGLTYGDFVGAHRWQYLRSLQKELANFQYRPSELREVKIPKLSGTGYRTLRLPVMDDRIVQRAIVEILQPLLDPTFDDRSFGFRPHRGRVNALAHVNYIVHPQERWVWVTEDIVDAFEQVPIQRLLDLVRRRFPADNLVWLLTTVLDRGQNRGVPQGGPLSPLMLNLYLDRVLDRVWRRRRPDIPLLRTADDILLLCRTRSEAVAARAYLQSLLQAAGMPLKGSEGTAVRNLAAGQHAHWLGLRFSLVEEELQVCLGLRAWRRLEKRLERASIEKTPERVCDCVEGWVAQALACGVSDDAEEAAEHIADLLYELGTPALANIRAIRRLWWGRNAEWRQIRARVAVDPISVDRSLR